MKRTRIAFICLVASLAAVGVASAQSANRSTDAQTAVPSTGASGGGTTQTVVVNTTSNPVATASVGVTAVRDADRLVSNRMTLLVHNSGGNSWTEIVDSFGQVTSLTAIPTGKVLVVTDVEISAYGGTPGDVAQIVVYHSSSGTSEYRECARISALGNYGSGAVATAHVQYVSGLLFGDVPALGFQGADFGTATLHGYLADATK